MSTINARTRRRTARRKGVDTLYEAELRLRHPHIAPEVLEAWSEGR